MNWAKKILTLLALVAVICGVFGAWRAHKRSFESKKFSDGVALSRTHAEQGDVKAELRLASLYYYGNGVPQDYTEALRWYRKAADQGDARAQSALGYIYYSGQGVQQDYSEAVRRYRQAADQGDADAQAALGYMYYRGQGVPRDYTQSRGWYRLAADHGNAEAQRALALLGKRPGGLPKLRYLELLIAFLGGSWFSLDFLLPGRNIRNRLQMTLTLLGVVCLSYVGLSLYGIAHDEMRLSPYLNTFVWAKKLLLGAALLILTTLLLAPKKKATKIET